MSPADIFTLRARDARASRSCAEREGYGETSVRNLFDAIDARRKISLDRVIYALGIRHIGETNARLLARHYGTMEALQEAARAASRRRRKGRQGQRRLAGAERHRGHRRSVVAEAVVEFFKEPRNVEALDALLERDRDRRRWRR